MVMVMVVVMVVVVHGGEGGGREILEGKETVIEETGVVITGRIRGERED